MYSAKPRRCPAQSMKIVSMANYFWPQARVAVLAAAVLSSMIGAPSAGADDSVCASVGQYCGFSSPSGNISCEINTGGRVGQDGVYCQTGSPAQSVTLDHTGTFQSCAGVSCLGDAAEGIPTLGYGQRMALGQFTCLSAESGVTCTTGGRGFTISRSGIGTA